MGKSDIKVINIDGGAHYHHSSDSDSGSDSGSASSNDFGSELDSYDDIGSQQDGGASSEDQSNNDLFDDNESLSEGGFFTDADAEQEPNDKNELDDFLDGGGANKKSLLKRQASISDSLIEELSSDPMFLVLSKFLVSKKGNSIADILEEIKDHLAFIRLHMRTD